MTAVKETRELFLSHFARLDEKPGRSEDSWLREIRRDAIGRFAALGFPTTRLEDWKYTSVAPIARIPFQAAEQTWQPGTAAETTDVQLAQSHRLHSTFSSQLTAESFVQ